MHSRKLTVLLFQIIQDLILRHFDSIFLFCIVGKKIYSLTTQSYEAGYQALADKLSDEINMLQYDNQAVLAIQNYLSSVVDLYKALGG